MHSKKKDSTKFWKQETHFTYKTTYKLKTKAEIVI